MTPLPLAVVALLSAAVAPYAHNRTDERASADQPGASSAQAPPKPEAGAPARPAVGSPDTVTDLLGTAAAAGPSTPLAEEGSAATSSVAASAASSGRRAPSPRPASPALSQSDSRSQGSFVAPAELHAVAAHEQAVASRRQELSLHHLRSTSGIGSGGGGGSAACAGVDVDVPSLVERLKQLPLTGQVVAWAWERAAALSAVRRTMPAQLFSALWPATEACSCRMMPQVRRWA